MCLRRVKATGGRGQIGGGAPQKLLREYAYFGMAPRLFKRAAAVRGRETKTISTVGGVGGGWCVVGGGL